MKKVFTICVLFFTTFCFGQTNFRVGLSGIDGADEYGFDDLVQMNDGSYICAGSNYVEADNTEGISIAKFNAQGQLLISKSLVPGSFDEDVEGIAIIKTADGGVAVSGSINDTICLLKFDANLTLSWHKQLVSDIENYSAGTRLIQTSDGGYMVAGSVDKVDSNNSDVEFGAGTVIKTNGSGDVLWAKQYFDFPGEASNYRDINDIIATKDGNFMLLIDAYSFNNSDDYDSTYLIKINSSGAIIWSKGVSSDLSNETPISIINTSDGGYLICGSAFPQATLIKLNQDGNVVWSRANDNFNYSTDLDEVKEDKDGGFIVAGSLDSLSTGGNFIQSSYFFKVNSSGNLVWTKVISSNANYESPFSLTFTSDGGFAAAGYAYLYTGLEDTLNFDRAILYKFDSDYNICGTTSPAGSLTDIHAATSPISVSVYDLNTSAVSTTLTATSAGTGINLCNTFPVQLLSFDATLQNKSVSIEWKTANEINTDYFTVERSSNGTAFTALQNVTAKGNSSNVQTYTTSDLQPMFGTSYYRLKEVDKDGKATYSNIVPVTVSANGTLVISPNPVRDNLRVLWQSKENGSVTFQVTDMSGRILATQGTKVNVGTNTIIVPAASLSKGLYVLKVIQNSTTQAIKFIKE